MFINPMWISESERIGMYQCTRIGYKLHAIADGVGIIATISLLVWPCLPLILAIRGVYDWHVLWTLVVPFTLGIIGKLLYVYSWRLAKKKNFHYDYDSNTAIWVDEIGDWRSYRYDGSAPSDDNDYTA
jgi:hypothetical protein